jgi:hypothetical protein
MSLRKILNISDKICSQVLESGVFKTLAVFDDMTHYLVGLFTAAL